MLLKMKHNEGVICCSLKWALLGYFPVLPVRWTHHTVKARKGEMYGIICTNCLGGAVVSDLDLRIYQIKWEEELQAILDSLIEHPFGEED